MSNENEPKPVPEILRDMQNMRDELNQHTHKDEHHVSAAVAYLDAAISRLQRVVGVLLLVLLSACATEGTGVSYAPVPPTGADGTSAYRDRFECEMMARMTAGSYRQAQAGDFNQAFIRALGGIHSERAIVEQGMANSFKNCLASRGWSFIPVGGG